MAHLLNCLSAGFTEIICVCDATVRRHRTESLLRQRIIPGQETCFHFLTLRQLQTRVTDIGQAAQKLEGAMAGGKALPTAVMITREEQDAIKQKLLGEIAERRAKAKAAKMKPPES